jgi:hypothetical protein
MAFVGEDRVFVVGQIMNNKFTIGSHFEKKAEARAIYDRLLQSLGKFGPITESPKKTSIHLDRTTAFAGIYVRQNYLLVHFRTAEPIANPRIDKCEQLSANRYKHSVKLESINEVDRELLGWLKKAYELAK